MERIGIDTGGTYTDAVSLSPAGIQGVVKVRSTPEDPAQAVEQCLDLLGPGPGFHLVHGTTVATNALLERKGAATAYITTAGFRDIPALGRQARAELYALEPTPRDPVVPASLRFEVVERLDYTGRVVRPLDLEDAHRVMQAVAEAHVQSVAICLLFSFANPTHERILGEMASKLGISVSLSSTVAPEMREYERSMTTIANAMVEPVMRGYLRRLESAARARGAHSISVMQSSGGAMGVEEASACCVRTALSGPAGGLVAAHSLCKLVGITRFITFDMGGTSTDVALVNGAPLTHRNGVVAGIPLLTPMLDIHTVGAGGGSIAWCDSGGALRVGPHSAGAQPGPAAWGVGTRATVTDAHVVLGTVPCGARHNGSVTLSRVGAERALRGLADELGCTTDQAAHGMVRVVNANMVRAVRQISVEKGHNPARYTLVAYGGAGPLHACMLAEELGMVRVLIPRYPGAFSAVGLATADYRREYARTLVCALDSAGIHAASACARDLRAQAVLEVTAECGLATGMRTANSVELRYVGQTHAIRVPLGRSLVTVARAFHRAHRRQFGYGDEFEPLEVVAVVATAAASTGAYSVACPPLPLAVVTGPPVNGLTETTAWCAYDRAHVEIGYTVRGPALVLQADATTVVAANWTAEPDEFGNLVLCRVR